MYFSWSANLSKIDPIYSKHANKGTWLVKNRQKRANVIKVWPLRLKRQNYFNWFINMLPEPKTQ